jgi:predicted Rossmann fold nucleotide-binding protein DprA/Smf involved in DNA uptake
VADTAASPSRRKVLVGGSRGWKDEEAVYEKLAELDPLSWEIMHGGADGADIFAYRAALDLGLTARSFLPAIGRPSPQRYHERNDRMLDQADRVIVFWDGKSRGTKSVIDKARRRGLEVEVIRG